MTLNELEIGERAIIKKVGGEGVLRRRLLDMGLTPKTEVMKSGANGRSDRIAFKRIRTYDKDRRRKKY